MVESLPRRFGKYVLQRRLGVGGMAETFVARRDDAVEQLVCVKRVLPAFNTDKDFIAQFVREARVAAKLRHSNIVGILDFGAVGSEHYMALELVDGVDMRGLLQMEKGERLDPELTALIGIQMAYALEYAHAAEVVHRDVTPSNILLSTHGEVKLADFGVAKALSGQSVATATGFIKGKVPYMAPEQMRGADIDGRVDLFSLGVTLFEALSGRRPFVGKHDVEVMMKVLEADRPKLAELVPDLPEGLADVVETLLAPKPEDRYADGGEVVDALAEFLGNEEEARDRLAEKVRAAYGVDTGGELATHDTEMAVQLPRVIDPPEAPMTAPETAPVEAVTAVPTMNEPARRPVAAWIAGALVLLAVFGGGLGVALSGDDEVAVNEPPITDSPATMATMEATMEPTATMETMATMESTSMDDLPLGVLPPTETEMNADPPEMVASAMSAMTRMTEMVASMEPEEEEESMRARGRGTVRVAVVPWGRVFYRGMSWTAPHELTLSVGTHTIGVGRERPTTTRMVMIEANKYQRITVDLDE